MSKHQLLETIVDQNNNLTIIIIKVYKVSLSKNISIIKMVDK